MPEIPTFATLLIAFQTGAFSDSAFIPPSGLSWFFIVLVAGLVIPFLIGTIFFQGARLLFFILASVFRLIGSTILDSFRLVGSAVSFALNIPLVMISLLFLQTDSAMRHGADMGKDLVNFAGAAGRLVIFNPLRFLGIKVGAPKNSSGDDMPLTSPEDLDLDLAASPRSSELDVFDGYKVIGTLPRGGSGARLFVAKPVGSKAGTLARLAKKTVEKVVIKSFSLEDGSTMPQIVRESRALEAARDLGLVFEHELTGSRFHYVMPFVPGQDLAHVTRDLHESAGPGGLDAKGLRAALSYFAELLVTIERFHAKGLWHKDIKPSNVIVSKGRVHLVDLGLVTPLRSAMTLTTHGTEYFRDPEMVRLAMQGVKVHEVDGVKFDLYSAGALLYSMLENSFPAHGSLSRFSRRVPECLQWIVRRSMTDLPKRYSSAVDMLADLQVVLNSSNPLELRPGDLPSMRGESMSFTGWDAGAANAPYRSHGFEDDSDGRIRLVGDRLEEASQRVRSRVENLSGRAHRKVARLETKMLKKAGRFEERANRPRGSRGSLVAILLFLLIGAGAFSALFLSAPKSIVEGLTGSPQSTVFSVEVYNEFQEVVTVSAPFPLRMPIDLDNLPAGAVVNFGGIHSRRHMPEIAVPSAESLELVNQLLAPLQALDGVEGILLLNTLPATFQSVAVDAIFRELERLEHEVIGLGHEDVDIELLARARQVVGVSGPQDPMAVIRLESFLFDIGKAEGVDVILWLGRGDGDDTVIGQVVGLSTSSDPQVISTLPITSTPTAEYVLIGE
jgi:serine/threonine protein kinase